MASPYPSTVPPQSMFGPIGQPQPGGMFGNIGDYQNRLIMGGMGMLSGRNPSEQWGNALQGFAAGSQADTSTKEKAEARRKEEERNAAMQAALKSGDLGSLSPTMQGLLAVNPDLMTSVAANRLTPKVPDMPNSFDEFKLTQGNPGYSEFLDRNKTGTTINMGQENEYDKRIGAAFAKDYMTMQQGARQAESVIGKLDRLGQALASPGVYTGAAGDQVATLKSIATGLGFEVEGTSESQIVKSISNEIALQLRSPAGGAGMPGAMSDQDREFLAKIPPGLANTPEGNAQKLEMLKRVQQRNVKVANLANEYQKKKGRIDEGFYQLLAQWSEQNPLFPEAAQMMPETPAGRTGQTSTGLNWSLEP